MNNIFAAVHPSFPNTLSYSGMLKAYLAQRPEKNTPFFISDWLYLLPQGVLNALDECAELAQDNALGSQGAVSDVLTLCKVVFAAEKQTELFPKNCKSINKMVDSLRVIAALVAISKVGYIQLYGPLALSSNKKFKYTVTEAGRKIGIGLGLMA